MARWSRGVRTGFNTSSHPVRFPAEHFFFLGGDGFILFYFETWTSDSFAYYLFSFYLFSDEIHVYCKQNFFGRSNSASTFFCWATLIGKDKQFILIIFNNGTQPRRGGRFSRVLDFSSSPQCRGITRGLSHICKHGSHI